MPSQLKKPMVAVSTPTSASRALRVENTSKNGSPAENPRNSMAITCQRV